MAVVYLSVGSNLGNRFENCRNGILMLLDNTGSLMLKRSPFYETEPVDYENQDWFVNAVLKIETGLPPPALLKELKRVEKNAGRNFEQVCFGPRILDLDILLYGNLVENTDQLIIPHPRMHKRRFVLKPLCDIAPEIVHPVFKKSMIRLLEQLEDCEQKIFPYA